MNHNAQLADRIAAAVVKHFNEAPAKAGKPVIRANGVPEWTVLAGLVTLQGDKIEVISVATGVKALPDDVRRYSKGWMVHDMHAEILCLRMLNYVVTEDVLNERQGKGMHLLERGEKRLRLRKDLKLCLYISEPPCGDASMSYVAQGREAWEEPPSKKTKIQQLGLHRGRESFDVLGVVRTKPGRADSKVTLSKSCSDKLCLRQETGVLNSINSAFVEPVYLDFIALPEAKFQQADFDRCFGRIDPKNGVSLQPLLYTEDPYTFHKLESAVPSPLSLVLCPPLKISQALLNGAKNGGFIKNKPPKPHGASIICNQKLIQKAGPLLQEIKSPNGELPKSYSSLKDSNPQKDLKNRLHSLLGWTTTTPDDFAL